VGGAGLGETHPREELLPGVSCASGGVSCLDPANAWNNLPGVQAGYGSHHVPGPETPAPQVL